MDGMLSQDEINALFNNMDSADSSDTTATAVEEPVIEPKDANFSLSETEKDAVGEISNICMGTAATTLSSLLNQKVNITTPKVDIALWDELSAQYDRPCVMMQISYKEGIDGNNVLILKERDVKIITDLMMQGTGEIDEDGELTELHLSAIGEAMNQMMGSAATSMSSMFDRKIDISPPTTNLIETYNEFDERMPVFLKNAFVMVAFRMQIGDLVDSEIMQLYPIDFAKDLLGMFMPDAAAPAETPAPAPQATAPQAAPTPTPAPQAAPTPASQPDMSAMQGMPMPGMPMQMPYGYGYGMPMQGMPMSGMPMPGMAPMQDVNVAPAAFQPFSSDISALTQKENIDLIMDVPLEVTVELGRTTKSIKDILEFSPGTIVELDKIAGEAVDVLVNGKMVAKGEVVVIEESFGVRVTEIIK